jgi:hypothetical protein
VIAGTLGAAEDVHHLHAGFAGIAVRLS